ncbi:hypothetical protein ACFFNY_34260 [Paenibacillus hodogayensis]|uniref:Cytosolic protein n=1 Tax=Paenibacillus hodogayensis TaxID=279208 RepID=A0ABV5W8Q8_9BACL
MPTFSHPAMPMYTQDHAAYIRQMHDWHNQMAHYHEQHRLFHLERAKHFHDMMGGRHGKVISFERPNDTAVK